MAAGYFQVILSAILFGLMPLFAKNIYAMGGNSVNLCFQRFAFGIPVLYLLARYGRKASLRVTKKQLLQMVILSLGLGGTPLLLFSSYNYISSGMTTTLHFVYPVLVVVCCVVFFKEKLTGEKLFCCILCVCGILCFYTPGEKGNLMGAVLALASGVTYTFYMLFYSHSGLKELDNYVLTFYLSCCSAVMLFLFSLATDKLVFYTQPMAWILALLLSLMVAVGATILCQSGMKVIGPENAALVSTMEPLTSVVVGCLVFAESMSFRIVAGIGCILSSVLLLTLADRKKQNVEK